MKEFSKVVTISAHSPPPPLIFEQIGIRQWKFFWEVTSMWTQFWPRPHPITWPISGRYVAGNIGHSQIWTQIWPKIFNIWWSTVPGGCTYWPALWGMKGTYLGFQSIIVSILDHMFKYGILGLVCRTPENREFLPISPKNAKMAFFRQIST